jgi:hypothetical protein
MYGIACKYIPVSGKSREDYDKEVSASLKVRVRVRVR